MKNKTGRRRTHQLNIRVTENEMSVIRLNAEKVSMTVSEYLRHLLVIDGKNN